MRDALRLELERRHRRYLQATLGSRHPASRLQELRTYEARSRLLVGDSLRTQREVQRAVGGVQGQLPAVGERDRVADLVDTGMDGIAELRDDAERWRDSLAVSLGGEDDEEGAASA